MNPFRQVCRPTAAVAAGYTVKFNFDGDWEVQKAGKRVKGGFWTEAEAWSWADRWARCGGG